MKEFESVDGKSFGFIEKIVSINGVEWAYVIKFTSKSRCKCQLKVSSIKIID